MHDLSPAPGPTENAIRWSFPPRVCLARVIISTNLNYAPGRSIISEASDGKRKKKKEEQKKKQKQNVAGGAKIKKALTSKSARSCSKETFVGKLQLYYLFLRWQNIPAGGGRNHR